MARNYLQALAKALSKLAGPLGSPIEFFLSLYQDQETQKRKAELDEMILKGQNLSREVLEEIFIAKSDIKELREQFIVGMQFCISLLSKNKELLSSGDLEENLLFLIDSHKEKLEASGFITDEVLADELYKCYQENSRLFLAHISADFPAGELPSYDEVLADELYKCYEKDARLFLAHISADFPVGELRNYEAVPVIISDFLTRCSGQGL
ncbi:hypothetical protein [Okeania sp. SIO2B3]|uniref:hypothetical protein n=1 Tax=Okeania sp. SIO2B3 TaxID=2607784 RepID=UPI0013BFC7BA|nr:hypothetical protein [Okeania sp. SIO2B3]NET42519.1 hypothetical protein [Okeania sp. SIO2B3]